MSKTLELYDVCEALIVEGRYLTMDLAIGRLDR